MQDETSSDASADAPTFTPVATSPRHDGWTAERQRGFIAALARIGIVGAAARAVGMSAKSAYALRKRAGAASFAAAWDGVVVPMFYRGLQVGERRRYDDRLLLAALRATVPGMRTADRGSSQYGREDA